MGLRVGDDQFSPEHSCQGRRGLSIVVLQIASHGLCEGDCTEEWEDVMLESQGRLNVIQEVFLMVN